MAKKETMDFNKWIRLLEATYLKLGHGTSGKKAMWEEGAEGLGEEATKTGPPKGPFSFGAAYVNEILSVKDFVEKMVKEAEEIMEGMAKQYDL